MYIYIYTLRLFIIGLTQRGWHTLRQTECFDKYGCSKYIHQKCIPLLFIWTLGHFHTKCMSPTIICISVARDKLKKTSSFAWHSLWQGLMKYHHHHHQTECFGQCGSPQYSVFILFLAQILLLSSTLSLLSLHNSPFLCLLCVYLFTVLLLVLVKRAWCHPHVTHVHI